MADAVFPFVETLAKLLREEAGFLSSVQDEINWLINESEWMMAFLEDAEKDAKQEQEERVKKLVKEIRKAAYEAEDIIDTYISQIASKRKQGVMGNITNLLHFKKVKILHEVGNKIRDLKKKIEEIPQKRETYGTENIGIGRRGGEGTSSFNERLWQVRRPCPYPAVGEFVVGRTPEINALVKELMKENKQRSVISIVGMGGLGKTTLARSIYNHNLINNHFTPLVWATVSKDYREAREIFKDILKNTFHLEKNEIDQMGTIQLERRVYGLLEGEKPYLVVLDDIWSINAWESLKNAFPDKGNQSRILITTRIKDVAVGADTQTPPYELRFLKEEESWELFCRKTFPENDTPSCPPNLEELGRKMVKKCDGLPLSLLLLGGMLSKKNKSPEEWDKVLDNISWHLTKSQDGSVISAILGLSYVVLPYHLKSCFKYLSLFPEDSEIDMKDLINYWIVEGMIPQQGRRETMENVAENYVNELNDRSLLQVVPKVETGWNTICRVHDLLRELSILKAKEENLLIEINKRSLNNEALAESPRRCVVHSVSGFESCCDIVTADTSLQRQFTQQLRTLIFSPVDAYKTIGKKQMKFICTQFRLLRVLDLTNDGIHCLPAAIGNLVHLRYLSIYIYGI